MVLVQCLCYFSYIFHQALHHPLMQAPWCWSQCSITSLRYGTGPEVWELMCWTLDVDSFVCRCCTQRATPVSKPLSLAKAGEGGIEGWWWSLNHWAWVFPSLFFRLQKPSMKQQNAKMPGKAVSSWCRGKVWWRKWEGHGRAWMVRYKKLEGSAP